MSKTSEVSQERRGPVIQRSYVWAAVIAIVISGWMMSGQIKGDDDLSAEAGANGEATSGDAPYVVRAKHFVAKPFVKRLMIRGQTSSLRTVDVRAETGGRVASLPVEKGALVVAGDVLCELEIDARQARLNEAQALMVQRKLEWEAAEKLRTQGHRSKTQTAGSNAAYESAIAHKRQMEIEFERTKIRAPFDGIFDTRQVELGDFMQSGQICGTVIDQDPFLLVAQVSESEVSRLNVGDPGGARLVSGEEVQGTIRYISSRAEPMTRTFRVELEVANAEGTLKEGITADILFPLQAVQAHLVSPAILGLNAAGIIGVRTVDNGGRVDFVPIEIIADTGDGVWITGLADDVVVITVGQELVNPGQIVETVMEQAGDS